MPEIPRTKILFSAGTFPCFEAIVKVEAPPGGIITGLKKYEIEAEEPNKSRAIGFEKAEPANT